MARSFPWAVAMRLVTAEPKPVRFARSLPVMACARRRGEVAQTCAQTVPKFYRRLESCKNRKNGPRETSSESSSSHGRRPP